MVIRHRPGAIIYLSELPMLKDHTSSPTRKKGRWKGMLDLIISSSFFSDDS